MIKLHRRYLRTIDLIVAAAAALRESGRAAVPECPPNSEDTILWTFESQQFAPQRRLRVRVGASGYVHAGVAREGGTWEPVYNIPLTPLPDGSYEAILPFGVDRFTFFWTEPPWLPDHPEGSYLRTRALADCFRCHDGKAEYQGKILSRKCETCHIPEKISNALLFN